MNSSMWVGLKPMLGRGFTADEDRTGGPGAALISEDLWNDLYQPGPVGARPVDSPQTIPCTASWGVLARRRGLRLSLQILRAAAYSRGFADRGRPCPGGCLGPGAAGPEDTSPRSTHPILVIGRLKPRRHGGHGSAGDDPPSPPPTLESAYRENDARGAHIEPLPQVVFRAR